MIKSLSRMTTHGSVRIAVNVKSWSPTETEWLKAAQCVQIEEKERIGKFVFQKDAKSSMVGRLLIRSVLSDMLGCRTSDIKLGRTDKGKPFLENCFEGFRGSFNVAHHGDFAVVAADNENSVGVDVMKVEHRRDMRKFFSTLRRQLTEQEWRTVESGNTDHDKMKNFFRFWCLKESYVKALGIGIGFEVGRLDFHLKTPILSSNQTAANTSVLVDGILQSDWLFEEAMLDEDHCVAIATKLAKDNKKTKTTSQGSPFQLMTAQNLLDQCDPIPGIAIDTSYWSLFNSRQEAPTPRDS